MSDKDLKDLLEIVDQLDDDCYSMINSYDPIFYKTAQKAIEKNIPSDVFFRSLGLAMISQACKFMLYTSIKLKFDKEYFIQFLELAIDGINLFIKDFKNSNYNSMKKCYNNESNLVNFMDFKKGTKNDEA